MLADLVEQLKKTGLQAAPADHCYAGAEDVACDVCTGRKLKADKSCLVCLASYCEKHLQPHYESSAFEKHKLVDPTKKLQENICSRHDEVMKMFCRTDQQCICYVCSVDEHKGHDTVSAAVERTERQRELELSQQQIQQRVQDREKDVKLLQQELEAVNGSADKAVEDSEKIFTELIRLVEKRSSDVKQQIRSQQETEANREVFPVCVQRIRRFFEHVRVLFFVPFSLRLSSDVKWTWTFKAFKRDFVVRLVKRCVAVVVVVLRSRLAASLCA
ncbi:hypothetical protein F2P81_000128 [Scophthalmus maximus]|uniref:B box-type domain-containing protein n=1 Tax=Scophthalmus maximus TaxID=52904 RepID=A0A6A4TMF2_SCOMX|nr:hypothetical protein F2P81_000128 [Scophthalmus maximus]